MLTDILKTTTPQILSSVYGAKEIVKTIHNIKKIKSNANNNINDDKAKCNRFYLAQVFSPVFHHFEKLLSECNHQIPQAHAPEGYIQQSENGNRIN